MSIVGTMSLFSCGNGEKKTDDAAAAKMEADSTRMSDSISKSKAADSMAKAKAINPNNKVRIKPAYKAVAGNHDLYIKKSVLGEKITSKNDNFDFCNNLSPLGDIPIPSAMMEIERSIFARTTEKITLGDINGKICDALASNGYDDKTYYCVPDGFALVTHIEQINEDGTSKQPPDRFSLKFSPYNVFSISSYWHALLNAPIGYFRLIIFVVSNKTITPKGALLEAKAKALVDDGNPLPKSIKVLPFTDNYSCVAYIYEFMNKQDYAKDTLLVPSDISGKQHLEKSGILITLYK